jgi:hypothetical protein
MSVALLPAKEATPDFARRANLICQGFAQSLAGKHDSSDGNRLVDLGPMSRVKDVNSGIPGRDRMYSATVT